MIGRNCQIGIIVPGFKVNKNILDRFVNSLKKSVVSSLYYQIIIIDQNSYRPKTRREMQFFNVGRAFNQGISTLQNKCDVIVCSSIDLIIPEGYLDITYEYCLKDKHFVGLTREVPVNRLNTYDWEKWKNLPVKVEDIGSWNAMTTKNWFKVGMWNENINDWNKCKDDLYSKVRNYGLKTIEYSISALIHVSHPNRFKKRK